MDETLDEYAGRLERVIHEIAKLAAEQYHVKGGRRWVSVEDVEDIIEPVLPRRPGREGVET